MATSWLAAVTIIRHWYKMYKTMLAFFPDTGSGLCLTCSHSVCMLLLEGVVQSILHYATAKSTVQRFLPAATSCIARSFACYARIAYFFFRRCVGDVYKSESIYLHSEACFDAGVLSNIAHGDVKAAKRNV